MFLPIKMQLIQENNNNNSPLRSTDRSIPGKPVRSMAGIRLSGFMLILLIRVGTILPAEAQVQEFFFRGIALADRGLYPEARNSLERAISIDKGNPEILLELARVCYMQDDLKTALIHLENLEAAAPGKGAFLHAVIYAGMGNTEGAVKQLELHLLSEYKRPYSSILLEEAFYPIEDSPEWKELWSRDWYTGEEMFLQEVKHAVREDDHLRILEEIDRRISENGDQDDLLAARGRILLEMDQYKGAEQSYSRAIKIKPGKPDHYFGRAQVYLKQDEYGKGALDLEKSCRLDPMRLKLLLETGNAFFRSGQLEKAVGYFERYIGYYSDDLNAKYTLGLVHHRAKKYFKALEQFNACLLVEKGDPQVFKARGITYLETKTYAYALNDFGMALDLDPEDHESWYMKGQARWYLNDREGAIGDWEHAARLGSQEAADRLESINR